MVKATKEHLNLIRLTPRDVEILKFINDFGFVEIGHIIRKFNFKTRPRAYVRLRQLTDAGLVKHDRIFHNQCGIYRVTAKGASYTELPKLTKLNLATYGHDTKIIDLSINLLKRYPTAYWISERVLKRNKHLEGVGKKGHLSDGILVMSDDTEIAIELELAKKGKARLKKIIDGYVRQFELKKIWYFCSEVTYHKVSKLTEEMNFIETFKVKDFLAKV